MKQQKQVTSTATTEQFCRVYYSFFHFVYLLEILKLHVLQNRFGLGT